MRSLLQRIGEYVKKNIGGQDLAKTVFERLKYLKIIYVHGDLCVCAVRCVYERPKEQDVRVSVCERQERELGRRRESLRLCGSFLWSFR